MWAKIVFTLFKFGDLFSVKDAISKLLKSYVIFKFVCPVVNACYIGETTGHLSTTIEEDFEKDKESDIFKYLNKIHDFNTLNTPDYLLESKLLSSVFIARFYIFYYTFIPFRL